MPSSLPATFAADDRDHALEERPPIAVEANFLRLPLFALHTKGLGRLDGFECRGKTTRGNKTWEFEFRTARNTATSYPGPLSRSVHLAFLSILTEQNKPLTNPISWSWRNLCARLEIEPSGWMIRDLKQAIEATAGLMIFSQDALYAKPTGERLRTSQALHLYDTVYFIKETMQDGRIADTNYLWLSQWYLDNLNSLFTAPLDYELWRSLEKQSPIASRLYEFLLLNFFSGTPQLRINYPRLAQYLPVRPERYFSRAQQQLETALDVLANQQVATATWQKHDTDVAQLCFERGSRLRSPAKVPALPLETATAESSLSLREIHRTPERDLVAEFYRLWCNRPEQRPTAKDLDLARRLLAEHGPARMQALLPLAVERLKRYWPGAKMFVALEQYVAEVVELERQHEKITEQRRREREETLAQAREQERQELGRKQREDYWEERWEELTIGEREDITNKVLERTPALKRTEHMLHSRCLIELAHRSEQGNPMLDLGKDVANGA